jgi:hypothetical protein
MAAKKKSARKSAKTAVACKREGGRPVHFKGMKKGEVVCFTKSSKKRKSAKKSAAKGGKRKQSAKARAASLRNLKKARKALKSR